MAVDPLALILLMALIIGTIAWAMLEFRVARDGRRRDGERRAALYHALLLDSFGTAFTIILLTRLWPGLPGELALFGLAPGFTAALAVRFHDGFADWLLEQIGR